MKRGPVSPFFKHKYSVAGKFAFEKLWVIKRKHGLDDDTEVIFVDPDKKKAWLPLTDYPHYDI